MILLDTHIWFWWVQGEARLSAVQKQTLEGADDLAVSVISCWEIAKPESLGRVQLPQPVETWLELALAPSGVRVVSLTPQIAVESTRLPGEFHRDPADQIIVATARVLACPLMTADQKILNYPHVELCAKPF